MTSVAPSTLLALTIAAAGLAALCLRTRAHASSALAVLSAAAAALAMARANTPGLGTLALTLAAVHLGWAALGSARRRRPIATATLMLLAAALDGGQLRPIYDWQATLPPLATLSAIAALLAARQPLSALSEASRVAAAAALAALPMAGPLFGVDISVEIPHDDGGLAVSTRASAAFAPASALQAQLWSLGRWAGVAAVALVLTRRRAWPLAAASISAFAAIAAGVLGWASFEDVGHAAELATADGPLAIVGSRPAIPSLAPVALRLGLTAMALELAYPGQAGPIDIGAAIGTRPALTRAQPWIGLIPAMAAPILASTLPMVVGAGWIADPATTCVLTLAATSALGAFIRSPPGTLHRLALDAVQCAAGLLLVGGAAGWRVASAWMP